MSEYKYIEFNQFASGTEDDRLLLFAAKAKDIMGWAGIPRKGWRVRMLYQRFVTAQRKQELASFWERASSPDRTINQKFILSPTAVVVAIQDQPNLNEGKIVLNPIDLIDLADLKGSLNNLANQVFSKVFPRLTEEQKDILNDLSGDGLYDCSLDFKNDFVFEFSVQLKQMIEDTDRFIVQEGMDANQDDLTELIGSLESVSKPGIIVDGQHRTLGANELCETDSSKEVFLPVVAIPNCGWLDQVYQFIVINEKAEKVESGMLNDILTSSISPSEQEKFREDLDRINVDIEKRIQTVLTGRDPESPFYNMVKLDLPDPPEEVADAYIKQGTIKFLIEGGSGSWSWRTEEDFLAKYISPTFTEDEWSDHREGKWKEYWYAFWHTIKDHFTPPAKSLKGPDYEIWNPREQTNLTLGVGLKMFQRYFMSWVIENADSVERLRPGFERSLPDAASVESALEDERKRCAIPSEIDLFVDFLRNDFLDKFPVRFFTGNWDTGLDVGPGREALLSQMKEAHTRASWRASGGGVFVPQG
jgi:hypothetical protein